MDNPKFKGPICRGPPVVTLLDRKWLNRGEAGVRNGSGL